MYHNYLIVRKVGVEKTIFLEIEEQHAKQRLDKVLAGIFSEKYSRSYFHKLFDAQKIHVEGLPVKKQHLAEKGQKVEICLLPQEEMDLIPEKMDLDILYEDKQLLALNKPAGLCVHPGAGNWEHTLVHGLLHHCRDLMGEFEEQNARPGIVHRLDKDTSGVMLVAKTAWMHARLVHLFSSRQIAKEYLAISWGNPGNALVDAPISRHLIHRKKMCVSQESGKEAITQLQTLFTDGCASVVKAMPKTGRTHQIRVHLQYKGSPILGDALYGHKQANERWKIGRQLLHAHKIKFTHPEYKKDLEFTAPVPEDIRYWMQKIGKSGCLCLD